MVEYKIHSPKIDHTGIESKKTPCCAFGNGVELETEKFGVVKS